MDIFFSHQQLLEKLIRVEQEVHLAFIDLEKAYDSIPRSKLWEKLSLLKVRRGLYNIIKKL